MAVASPAIATALATSPAFAADSTYDLGSGNHTASGGLIWLNRSVTVQGSVTDIGGAGTQVVCDPWANNTELPHQTRTAVDGTTSYNFTLDGSQWPGGITEVLVLVIDLHTGYGVDEHDFVRP
ncbi:hypothetical protein [Actinacidiphila acididurans]|uniref:Uncharacterized protein n=1 Tax=Actinacidiphila acididurans TaxID=2784346 RepID=A0ABS2TWY6_9ACTN|nr:hypothetical protein [Actinacidiphila acididurans]MBM9507854.1 hypothetical protein [Actinacidiphila acididurans]